MKLIAKIQDGNILTFLCKSYKGAEFIKETKKKFIFFNDFDY